MAKHHKDTLFDKQAKEHVKEHIKTNKLKLTHKAILFDLDGTLLDSAPDLIDSLNQAALTFNYPITPLERLRHHASNGARGLIEAGLGIMHTHPDYLDIEHCFLDHYQANSTKKTKLFPGFEQVLEYFDTHEIPWGIVTNKPEYLTFPILEKLNLRHRSQITICGDTLGKRKPDPLPLLVACEHLKHEPKDTLYVGDAKRDIEAGQRAGMNTVVALFGYIDNEATTKSWGADFSISDPSEIKCLMPR